MRLQLLQTRKDIYPAYNLHVSGLLPKPPKFKKSCYSTYLTKIEEMTHQNSGKDKNAPSDDS